MKKKKDGPDYKVRRFQDSRDGSTITMGALEQDRQIAIDPSGIDRAFFEKHFEDGEKTSPFAKGLAFENGEFIPSLDFSQIACVQIAWALYYTVVNHHGLDYAKWLFHFFGQNGSEYYGPEQKDDAGPTQSELEILRRYAAMKKPNITRLAKELRMSKRHVQRVINTAPRKYGKIRFSPPSRSTAREVLPDEEG